MKENIPPVLFFQSAITEFFILGNQMHPAATVVTSGCFRKNTLLRNKSTKYGNLLPDNILISRTAHATGTLARCAGLASCPVNL